MNREIIGICLVGAEFLVSNSKSSLSCALALCN